MDKELFDLCKQVYEKTGWNNTEFFWVAPPLNNTDYEVMHKSKLHQLNDYIANPDMIDKMYNSTFCYDSDYILEKLPGLIGAYQSKWVQCLRLAKNEKHGYLAGYIGTDLVWTHSNQSDTPLKALLKLTLALSEAGEL